MENNSGPEQKKNEEKRIFASYEDYSLSYELMQKRDSLLKAIEIISDLLSNRLDSDPVLLKSKVAELRRTAQELDSADIKKEALDQHLEPQGHFKAEARMNPKIMIDWISHDVTNIINDLHMLPSVDDFHSREKETVESETEMSFMKGEDLTKNQARFVGVQMALTFYQKILDFS
jgi:hypothetical protein